MTVQTGFAIAGGAVGFAIGGPTGAAIGFSLGNAVGGVFFGDQPGGQTLEGPRLNDTTVTTSTYGKGIQISFGTTRNSANMIWAEDIVEVRKTTELQDAFADAGFGKGQPSPPESTQITFEYFGNFAMAFGEGPGFTRRVFGDGDLLIDLSDIFDPGASRTFKYGGEIYRMYDGGETQLPDPLIELDKGVGMVPAHRGLIYVVFDMLPLRDFGNRIPQVSAEVVKAAPSSFLSINHNYGGLFQNNWIDLSGATTFGFSNPNVGTVVRVYNRVTGTGVDTLVMADLDNMQTAFGETGLGTPARFLTGTMNVCPNNGMLSFGLTGTTGSNNGGVGVHVGVMRIDPLVPPDHPWYDLREGEWQCVRSNDFDTRVHRIVRLGILPGTIWLFGNNGLGGGFDRLVATHTVLWQGRINVFETTGTNAAIPTTFNGTAVGQNIFTGGGGNWQHFAYDPDGGRCWWATEDGSVDLVMHDGDNFDTITDMTAISGFVGVIKGMAYDRATGNLLIATSTDWFLVDPNTREIVASAGPNTPNPITDGGSAGLPSNTQQALWENQDTIDRIFHTQDGLDQLSRWTTDDLTTPLARYNDSDFTGDTWDANGDVYWDPLVQCFTTRTNGGTQGFVDRFSADTVPLSDIITSLIERSDILGASDIDVTALTGINVRGFQIDNPSTIRSMIMPLQRAFFFDGAEVDGKILFKTRDNASIFTIDDGELGARIAGQEAPQRLIEPRKQVTEVPSIVDISYHNIDNDHQIGTQRDERIKDFPLTGFKGVTRGRHKLDMRLPIVLNDQEAREIAQKALVSGWVERNSLVFALPPKYMILDPTDVIVIQKNTSGLVADLKIRLVRVEMGPGGVTNCEGVFMESAVFNTNVVAATSGTATAGPIPYATGTNMFLLNMPNLRGFADEDGGAWWGAAPNIQVENTAWVGAQLFRALGVDDPRTQVDTTVRVLAWGTIQADFGPPAAFTNQRDRTITMSVLLATAGVSFSTLTDLQLFDGGNFAFLPATGELLQFQTPTQINGSQWDLDDLLRGRLGSDVFITENDGTPALTALEGAEIVFLGDLSALLRFSSLNEMGLERTYEIVTLGQTLGLHINEVEQFTNRSTAQKPFGVAMLEATRDGSDNLDITWLRRTRYNGELLDLVDVPVNEVGESYELDVLDRPDTSGAVVLRTQLAIIVEADEYSKANQDADVADGGDFPLSLTGNISNPGFETETVAQATESIITGWQDADKAGDWGVTTGALGAITGADVGSNFLSTTDTAPDEMFRASDAVLLGGLTPPLNLTAVDVQVAAEGLLARRFRIEVTGRSAQGNASGLSVETRIQIRFIDEDGAEISRVDGTASGHSVAGTWENRSSGVTDIPVGTRSISIALYSNDVSATNAIQIGWDDIQASITDVGSGPQPFTVDVYQISDTVGRGYARRAILPPFGQDQS